MKTGRNEKCWCGSGEKFKRCHYGRENEDSITKGDIISQSNKIGDRKNCYVPSELKHECEKRIINAHTISKSSSLKEIADSTNHVLGLKIDMANMFKNKGKLIPEKIGINKASTFKGFCSKHDKELFSCMEDHPFIGTEQQCLALMYRSVAREVYAKEGGLLLSEISKNGDKGKSLLRQLYIQNFVASNKIGLEAALRELSDFKKQLDDQLLGKVKNNLSHLIIEASSPMPIAVSSIISPVYDFEGNLIQDLGNLKITAESLVFNSFSSDGKGYVVFSWVKDSKKVLGFINTFLKIKKTEVFSQLVRLFFGFAENTFISPYWWDGLTLLQKSKIESLIMSGVDLTASESNNLLVDDGIQYTDWDIDLITKLNF